jgi:hypothetical protein
MEVIIISLPSEEYVIWVPKENGYLLNHPTNVASEIKHAWVMTDEQLQKAIDKRGLVVMALGHSAHG